MLVTTPGGFGRPIVALPDVEAFEQFPLPERDLPANTYDMLERGAAIAPDQPALSFFLRSDDFREAFVWTHAELLADITKTANTLRRLGVGRDDVVAFVLPNLPETHFVIWGSEAAGIAFAVNPLLEAGQISELLAAGRAKWLVTLAPFPGYDIWQKATRAAANLPDLQGILTVSLAPYLRYNSDDAPEERLQIAGVDGLSIPVLSLREEMNTESGDRLTFDAPTAGDISSYFCTGGTTGLPKIAARTHLSEVFDAWSTKAMTGDAFAPGKTIFCGLPLFHVNGQLVTGLIPWSQGGHVVLGTPHGYRGEGVIPSFWEIVEHYRIVAFSGVPTVFSALLQVPVGGRDISSAGYGFCGAAPMPVELFRTFEKTIGIRILEAYGLTEGACVSSVNPPEGERRIGSIGLRLPYQQMASVRLDDSGTFLGFAGTEEVGVLAIRGPNVFAGYVNAEHNKGLWIEIDGERWLNTGDLARQDADGYFWLTGRRKELIIRGGHNIDPKLIEDAVQDHPAVQLAAAVGRPDERAGELPILYVQLKPAMVASEADLLAHAVHRIPERAAHPKFVRILSSLPVTPVGKIFKPALSMLEIEDVVRQEAEASGIRLISLAVVQDARLGLLATIATDSDPATLREKLGRYAFKAQFQQSGNQS
ncbi:MULTISPECIES: acyl-CoA synthetase [Rhizobium]|uniref:Acyl-coenzyme A synthetase n=1 Tax=Rhizobium favelukesii TaxID=348824 RepID=W6RNH5_9HYPH|nr:MULTISPECIES: acyl-CoA synthetase [Rhizobium]MCS0457806.1 acyl-CoA synthetase [Rhizobium favelukesii]UFS80454.1 acyl-CoA synthetase [Rhizobium sp. T136]CDM62294.1 putative acyl-coenzyme A synthetase [Rhizobium favelukesii]